MKTTTLPWLLLFLTSVCWASPVSVTGRLEESEGPRRRGERDTDGAVQSEKEQKLLEQLQMELQKLRAEKQSHEGLEKIYREMAQFSEKQAVEAEHQIRAEFQRLRSFLQEEEQKALSALREERQSKKVKLQKVRERLGCLNNTIHMLEKHVQTEDSGPTQTSVPDLQPKGGLLLDQAKILGNLGFRVWKNMRRIISHSPVILDPNTANKWLHLSEDLRGMTNGNTFQEVPNNSERFSRYFLVIGSEGFSSGSHQWDVEVGDHPRWNIGVAKESVDRKGEVFASPQYGVWILFHDHGNFTNGNNVPVPVKDLRRLRVKLDYEQGQVSFYSIDDVSNMTLLYTHHDTFTEKLFPYFSVGKAGEAETKEIRILPDDPSPDRAH